MSTDATLPGLAARRFRRLVLVTVAVLLVATAGLTTANAVRGPQISAVQLSVDGAVGGPGQRLVLRLDQPLDPLPAAAVVVTPATPVDVTADAGTVALRFREALRYATAYTVTLTDARSRTTGASATLRYSFTTPEAALYVLRRGGATQDDMVVRHSLPSGATSTVFTAPRIQEFAVGGPTLAVVAQDEAKNGTLLIVPVDASSPARVLVAGAEIDRLHFSADHDVLGFTFVRPEEAGGESAPLYLRDAASGSDTLLRVGGLDRQSLAVRDWTFVPGTRQLVAESADSGAVLVDPLGGTAARPLGTVSGLWGFVPGTTRLLLNRQGTTASVDLTTGAAADVPVSIAPGSSVDALLPRADGRPLVVVGTSTPDDTTYLLGRAVDGAVQPVRRAATSRTWLTRLCGSPNGEYASVEEASVDAPSDGYAVREEFTGTTTVVLDAGTGAEVARLDGTDVSWCS